VHLQLTVSNDAPLAQLLEFSEQISSHIAKPVALEQPISHLQVVTFNVAPFLQSFDERPQVEHDGPDHIPGHDLHEQDASSTSEPLHFSAVRAQLLQ
jgi:hypothetical protein